MHPHEPHRKSFINLMEEIGRQEGRARYEVLSDFLEAGYRAIRGSVLKGTDHWQANEDDYMRIVKRCRHPEQTMKRLSEMLAVTVEALEAQLCDFLGPTFMEIGGSGDLGQFFTPPELSRMMARMNLGDIGKIIEGKGRGYFTASEPAAGMGGMVLAIAEYMREQGFEPARHCHWQMIDVEFKAMAGCYIQTSLAGVSGVVQHGNTLSLEMWSASPTPMAMMFPKRFDPGSGDAANRSPEDGRGDEEAPLPIAEPTPGAGPTQMTFDFSV